MHLTSGKWECMTRLLVLTLNMVNFEFFAQKMPEKWLKRHFLTEYHWKWSQNDPKIGVSTRKRCLYANSHRRGRGYDVLSIFWNFFSNSSTFFGKKCHFWQLISRELEPPRGKISPFWVGNSFSYSPFSKVDSWKCLLLELWALESGLTANFNI